MLRHPALSSELVRLLSGTRLLTLTGVGGCGKTRLALDVARLVSESYPDGVWFVGLASIADPALVAQAVATTLGIRETPAQPLLTTISTTQEVAADAAPVRQLRATARRLCGCWPALGYRSWPPVAKRWAWPAR